VAAKVESARERISAKGLNSELDTLESDYESIDKSYKKLQKEMEELRATLDDSNLQNSDLK